MGRESSRELALSLLLTASLFCYAFSIHKIFYTPYMTMTWTEARLRCQNRHIDMITGQTVSKAYLTDLMRNDDNTKIWLGLQRDPENQSAWRWINIKTGEGLIGDDVSQSINWADGETNRQCVIVSDEDQMWHTAGCSSEHEFYCSVNQKIIYHEIKHSWYNASKYCRIKRGHLATITKDNAEKLDQRGWIGLYRGSGGTWSWVGEQESDYRNWGQSEPLSADCAYFDSVTQKWHSDMCSNKHKTVCFEDNLVLVKEEKVWEEALAHCQNMSLPCSGACKYKFSLLSVLYTGHYDYVRDRIYYAKTSEVWTGLRFLGGEWWWVDKQKLKAEEKLPDCPAKRQHCGTLSKHNTDNWIIRDCSMKKNFICQKIRVTLVISNKTSD